MTDVAVVRDEARRLVARAVRARDRVLITGATGWFGTTMLALLADTPADGLLLTASRSRSVEVSGRTLDVVEWDDAQVRRFDPTIVLNFAFLTRDKEAVLGAEDYARTNTDLSRRFVEATMLPSVRAALTVSSGAALMTPEGEDLPIGSYGVVKRTEETRAGGLVTADRAVVVARAWSLSGCLVQRPHDYAFSDLVLQARTGAVVVKATSEVWRRYCGVDDYLAVVVARVLGGWSGVIDSGGQEVELRALADRVATLYPGPRPTVVAADPVGPPLRYRSDDRTWRAACAALEYSPAGLAAQIRAVQAALP